MIKCDLELSCSIETSGFVLYVTMAMLGTTKHVESSLQSFKLYHFDSLNIFFKPYRFKRLNAQHTFKMPVAN